MRILFVCTGNTCRSPMAHAYFAELCRREGLSDVEVCSAGTYALPGVRASKSVETVMLQYSVDMDFFRSSALNAKLIDSSDLIIAMTDSHREHIIAISPEAESKTALLLDYDEQYKAQDVPDPYGGSPAAYRQCFEHMQQALNNLFMEVLKENK